MIIPKQEVKVMETQTRINAFVSDFNNREFEPEGYYKIVLKYCETYIVRFEEYFGLEIEIKNCIGEIKKALNILKRPFFIKETSNTKKYQKNKDLKIFLENNGLDIIKVYNQGLYKKLLPEYVSMILVFSLLINNIRKSNIVKKGLEDICKLFDLSYGKARVVLDFIRKPIEELYETNLTGFRWSNKKFRDRLYNLWKNTGRKDVKMLIDLFRILGLNFKEFCEKIAKNKKVDSTGSFFYAFENHKFSYARYIEIKKHIREYRKARKITSKQYRDAIKRINKTLNIVGKTLKHLLFYHFDYSIDNIRKIKDKTLSKKLLNFMENIMKNNYPLYLFEDSTDNGRLRSSYFKLKGITKEKLKTDVIEKKLVNFLVDEGKMKLDDVIAENLKNVSQKAIKIYTKEYIDSVGHEPIQAQSMLELKQIIGMEIPAWIEGNRDITGHIDLIGVDDDMLVIAEYKPEKAQVYKGIVQACIYGLLISDMLKIKADKIKCIIYCPDLALSFKPNIAEDILQFIHNLNLTRQSRLMLNHKKPYDYETELKKLSKLR